MRTFIVCDDENHAEVVDALICSRLQDVDGNLGSRWSGVHTNGTAYGVLWAPEAAALFDEAEVPLEAETIGVDGASNWEEVPAPEPESEEAS